MKKILIAVLFLLPLFSVAQKESKVDSKLLLLNSIGKSSIYSGYAISDSSLGLRFNAIHKPIFKMMDSSLVKLMEVDTSGIIHVYGDTINVVKGILKYYHIKYKE